MITLEDCIGLCGLTEEEVLAVAEHEYLPEIAATAFAQYLLSSDHGSEVIRDMIVEDIQTAQRGGNEFLTPCPPSLFADASRSSTG
jgi:hypothetical protein